MLQLSCTMSYSSVFKMPFERLQSVTIRTSKGQTLLGILIDKCDWSIGCPVVLAKGIMYGVGYQADIVDVVKPKLSRRQKER